jgi:hypothetical protein
MKDKSRDYGHLNMGAPESTLIFVYNADSGLISAFADGISKIISPQTYQCRLCSLTFGTALMKTPWREFVDSLGVPVEFLHRDEFTEKYEYEDAKFPSAYMKKGDELSVFISQDEMDAMETLEELMRLVEARFAEVSEKNTENDSR